MAKSKTQYVCQSCGGVQSRWSGKCLACSSWNTLQEEAIEAVPKQTLSKGKGITFSNLVSTGDHEPRLPKSFGEFDRVCGGGLVEGSVVLIGGDPGIGKSTLLLQIAAHLSKSSKVAYISGEEAIAQVRLRAKRLKCEKDRVALASATCVNDIITSLEAEKPHLVIIDSIQTMYANSLDASPGSVAQVRLCTQVLTRFAKKTGTCVILVGHVTKEGAIAGPRVLEHMVDVVLYFEGERTHQFRILRGVKNRFGATDEIGVFDMTAEGLREVTNPSELFLSERSTPVSGSVVFAGIEGTRPLLVEIQALTAPTSFGTPRRACVGTDPNRLSMILAILEARAGIQVGMRDVYLNVAGGLKIQEPAADLAAAAALVSSITNEPLSAKAIFIGELGLSGEVRAVSQLEARLKEAEKLGFEEAYLPNASAAKKLKTSLKTYYSSTIVELAALISSKVSRNIKSV